MPKTEMVNCHVHTFTTAHAPRDYPHPAVRVFRAAPWLLQFLRWLSSLTAYDRVTTFLKRLEDFHRTGSRDSQRAVFRELLHYYPRTTRFVVLPMDMAPSGHGPVQTDLPAQHDELAALARDADYGPQVIPFATIHPDRPEAAQELRRCIEVLGFRGVKIYPSLGFAPDHPVLMQQVYPLCIEHDIPVMTHCSRGGIHRKGWNQDRINAVTKPAAYVPILRKFEALRLCLAHFGGDADWIAHLQDGYDPDDPSARERNWVSVIDDMITCGDYPNLYTDVSYTIFNFEERIPLLRMFLTDKLMQEKVLFGSDFYMTRQEALSEKAMSIRLRDALGECLFHRIAHENPRRWLGEA